MSKPIFNTDEETAFVKKVIDSLIKDLTNETLATNFNSRKERREYLKRTAKMLGDYGAEFEKQLLDRLEKTFDDAYNGALFVSSGFAPTLTRIPSKRDLEFIFSLNKLIETTKDDIDGLFSNSINTLKRNLNFFDQQVRQEILTELAKSATSGSSIDDISRRIQDLLIRNGITGIETDTRTYKLQASAERLARQTLITGRQRAVILEAIRNGHDLIRISKHGDESPMCKPHSGKIYSITGLTEGYELLESVLWNGTFAKGSGVGHPYCRHSFTVHIPTNIEFVIFSREDKATRINNQNKTQREDFLEKKQLKWERMSQADKNKWVRKNV
jgi:hypothetical protein